MRRTIVIAICVISLIFSIGGIVCCCIGFGATAKVLSESQVTALETSIRTYATAIDAMRDSVDVTGAQIPIYAQTLRKGLRLFKDAHRAADELEKITSTAINIPGVGKVQPFGSMDKIVKDLRDFLPDYSKSIAGVEKTLSTYTEEDHAKIIDSIDKTVLLLKITADELHEQVMFMRTCLYGVLTAYLLTSLAYGALAIAVLLLMSSKSDGDFAAPPRKRKVTFA